MIVSDSLGVKIHAVLDENKSKLEDASYTDDRLISLLSKLAAATWHFEVHEIVAFDEEAAQGSMSLGPQLTPFLQLCTDLGFLSRNEDGSYEFRELEIFNYFAARGLMHFLSEDYSDRGRIRDRAAKALQQIGGPAVPLLIEALDDKEDAVCLGAAVVLRRMGPTTVPALTEALRHGNRRIRRWVTEALASHENANAALPELVRVLEEDDQLIVLGGAVGALGESRNPKAEPGLIAALRHEGPLVRTLAKAALEQFDSPRARRALDDYRRRGSEAEAVDGPPSAPASVEEEGDSAQAGALEPPRIFLSYAREDVHFAIEIRRLLKLAGFDPWMDSAGLLAGEDWEARLLEVIRTSDFVVALLSEHTLGGYQETELRIAMVNAPSARPPEAPYVLPCVLGHALCDDLKDTIPDFLIESDIIKLRSIDANWRLLHKALCASARLVGLPVPALLRSKASTDLDGAGATRMIVDKYFFDMSRNKSGRPAAARLRTQLNGALVEDSATGRIWTRSCSKPLPYLGETPASVVAWKANQERLGDAGDWRLPTLEEAMSVMTREPNSHGLHISDLFSDDDYVLTCDTQVTFGGEPLVWAACYIHGDCQQVPAKAPVPVRLVRTDWGN